MKWPSEGGRGLSPDWWKSKALLRKRRKTCHSLQGTADDIAELCSHTAVKILDNLDKQYGGMIAGEELLVDFLLNFTRAKTNCK